MKLKKSIIIWLTIIFSGTAHLFWNNDFVYGLPASFPKNCKMVDCGDKVIILQNMRRLYPSPPVILTSSTGQDYTQRDSALLALNVANQKIIESLNYK